MSKSTHKNKDEAFNKRVEELIEQLKDDNVSKVIPERREQAKKECQPHALIWNLLTSDKYKFSGREYEAVFYKLTTPK